MLRVTRASELVLHLPKLCHCPLRLRIPRATEVILGLAGISSCQISTASTSGSTGGMSRIFQTYNHVGFDKATSPIVSWEPNCPCSLKDSSGTRTLGLRSRPKAHPPQPILVGKPAPSRSCQADTPGGVAPAGANWTHSCPPTSDSAR